MRTGLVVTAAAATTATAGFVLYQTFSKKEEANEYDMTHVDFPKVVKVTELDEKIHRLSGEYVSDAIVLLKELIKVPAGHLDDPLCGTSNHERYVLELLKEKLVEHGAVANESDIYYDDTGSLVWTVCDPDDNVSLNEKRVVFLDGHIDTAMALSDEWKSRLGDGIDPFNGLSDSPNANVDEHELARELGYVPDRKEWDKLVFGRGSVGQLQGIVAQVFATKILLETKEQGSLKGVKVVSIATVAGDDNEGMASMSLIKRSGLDRHEVPDCVVLTEATGALDHGPCGIYIGQRGRCQIELEVVGRSCHGAMPSIGVNPLEYGSLIVAEAAEQAKGGFKNHPFLGRGSRTASKCLMETPSDCAVPSRFVARFDRRLTKDEDAQTAIDEISGLPGVRRAREAGCRVTVKLARYNEKNYKEVQVTNDQEYTGWLTRPNDPVVMAAYEAYQRVVSRHIVEARHPGRSDIRKEPRIHRWVLSTNGVGYNVKKKEVKSSIEGKNWTEDGEYLHPPMFGIGAGYEEHCHKIGEYVFKEHLWCPIAVIARFPSLFVEHRTE